MRQFLLLFFFILLNLTMTAQNNIENVRKQIEVGNFRNAAEIIESIIEEGNLTHLQKEELEFEYERMSRIRKDFRKTTSDVLTYLNNYFPDITEKDLEKWEKSNKLESKYIDGKKFYFSRAHTNLFLLDAEARKIKEQKDGATVSGLHTFLGKYIPKVVERYNEQNNNLINPVKLSLNYTVTVDANVVPEGEVIRCWLPYPREDNRRQKDVKLESVNSDEYIIADNKNLQRTLYLEKIAEKDKPTIFNYELEYSALAEFNKLDVEKIQPYDINSDLFKEYTSEKGEHVVFSEKIRNISKEIVGEEQNPYLKAKKIFTWIDQNIPWAGAREYSTLYNIPDYVLTNMHGDCGQVSLLFITLCRYNGVPAKWQSGWMLHPGEVNLHDWAEVYFEGYGWVPVDQSFGITKSDNEDVKYFFLGGMDSYRMIVNDDISSSLFPAKLYPRSETVDFQRGELEWKGGNIYFDMWDYNMLVKYSE